MSEAAGPGASLPRDIPYPVFKCTYGSLELAATDSRNDGRIEYPLCALGTMLRRAVAKTGLGPCMYGLSPLLPRVTPGLQPQAMDGVSGRKKEMAATKPRLAATRARDGTQHPFLVVVPDTCGPSAVDVRQVSDPDSREPNGLGPNRALLTCSPAKEGTYRGQHPSMDPVGD